MKPNPSVQQLLPLLDGTRDRPALRRELRDLLQRGILIPAPGFPNDVNLLLDRTLAAFGGDSLFVAVKE